MLKQLVVGSAMSLILVLMTGCSGNTATEQLNAQASVNKSQAEVVGAQTEQTQATTAQHLADAQALDNHTLTQLISSTQTQLTAMVTHLSETDAEVNKLRAQQAYNESQALIEAQAGRLADYQWLLAFAVGICALLLALFFVTILAFYRVVRGLQLRMERVVSYQLSSASVFRMPEERARQRMLEAIYTGNTGSPTGPGRPQITDQ